MSLPPEIQTHVDQIRALLGVPPCQIIIHCDAAGVVQKVQPMVTYSRESKSSVLGMNEPVPDGWTRGATVVCTRPKRNT